MTRNHRRRRGVTPETSADRYDPAINGPTGEAIGEALSKLVEGNPKEMPAMSAVKTLQDAGIDFPVTVGNRRIMAVSITRGKVGRGNGHLRSDDHISRYEVEYPAECPEDDCWSEVTRYKYSANHHIAGSERTYCPTCETIHDSEEWH